MGPLIIFKEDHGFSRAVRNLRGVDFCNIRCLNLLKLCPGGHVGRLLIWTESAFRMLSNLYGTDTTAARYKKGYIMPRTIMINSDLNRIINSQEVQSAIRPKKPLARVQPKRNPLKHPHLYARLNPLFAEQWKDMKKNYPPGKHPRTTRVLKPLKKKQRVESKLTDEEKKKMYNYWNIVMGDTPIFKTRAQLEVERNAVLKAMAAAEREKKGMEEEEKSPLHSPKKLK